MKKLIAVLLFFAVFLSSAAVVQAKEKEEPTAGAILFDVVLIRPLSIVSIAMGAGVFVVALPFSLPTGTVGLTAKKLVVEPFKFTFARPVGETRDEVRDSVY